MIPQVFTFFRLKARFLKLDHKEGVIVSENDLTYYIISAVTPLLCRLLSCHCGPSWWSPEKRCSHPFFDFQSFFLKESRCLSSPLTFPPKRGHSQSALRQIYKVNNAIEFSISSSDGVTSFERQQLLNYLGDGKSSQFFVFQDSDQPEVEAIVQLVHHSSSSLWKVGTLVSCH